MFRDQLAADGVVLTTLGTAGRMRIAELEIATAAPLRASIEAGIDPGVFRDDDVDLTLKHSHFGLQTRHVLNSIADVRRA